MSYKIKQLPEDFVVKEIFSPKLKEQGQYIYCLMVKKKYNTLDAIKKIGAKLHVREKDIGFAGSKDRNAITEQIISINNPKINKEKLESLEIKDIVLEMIGYSDDPVSLGDHEGNEFIITVRNLEKIPKKIEKKFINYFGEQRFSKNNAEIGKAIIKKDFKKAVELIDNEKVKEYIKKNPNDPVNALRQLPLKLISMFVHAYQSLIWNTVAENVKVDSFPTPGFNVEYQDEKVKKLVEEELEKDKITSRDFIIRQIPYLRTEGKERKRIAEAKDFEIIKEDKDELNSGKKKLAIKFKLDKGSYATEFIKHLFEN